MSRERDVRNEIQALLIATNAFTDVWMSGLPENYGQGASDLTAAAVEPSRANFTAGWDAQQAGTLDYADFVDITVLVRNPDPQLRDEQTEQLKNIVINAVNGAVLVPGFVVPGKTIVGAWTWQPATPPERRIKATLRYSFLVQGWNAFDVTP